MGVRKPPAPSLDLAASAAGLPERFTPYSLRHTCASIMAQQGVPVTTAAAILGHDPAMFLRVYSHLYPGDMRGAASALDTFRSAEIQRTHAADVVQPLRPDNPLPSTGG